MRNPSSASCALWFTVASAAGCVCASESKHEVEGIEMAREKMLAVSCIPLWRFVTAMKR